MSLAGQQPDSSRYTIIPRTISFVLNQNEVLLIKLASTREAWAGKYNGVGGHIELGESPLSAAQREVKEETGLTQIKQQLCGVIMIDTKDFAGIGLFVFIGESAGKELSTSTEGVPSWIPLDRLSDYELVEDLGFLIPRALEARATNEVFFATYSYDTNNNLIIAGGE